MIKKIALYMMLGFCISANAQNPIQYKMTYYTVGQDGKESILYEDESIEDEYVIDFRGKQKNIETDNEGVVREENADLYVYVPKFTEYDCPLNVCLAIRTVIPYKEAGFLISKKPIDSLDGETTDLTKTYTKTDLFYVYDKQVYGTVIDATRNGFNLSQSVTDKSCQLKVMLQNTSSGDSTQYTSINIGTPAYCTDYYIRPYAILENGEIMLGGQKVFTSSKTTMGYIANNNRIGKVYSVVEDIVVTQAAIEKFCNQHKEILGGDTNNIVRLSAIAQELQTYIQKDYVPLFLLRKNISGTEPCSNGTISFVDELPESVASDYWVYMCQGISIDLVKNLNLDIDYKGAYLYTKDVNNLEELQYDTLQNGNTEKYKYVWYEQVGARNPYIAFDVPNYVMPLDYDIYISFVNLPEDKKPARFFAFIWESQLDGETDPGEYPQTGVRLENPNAIVGENSSVFSGNGENILDTIYLGRYTFKGASKNMIQIRSQVSSVQKDTFTRAPRIAEIKLIPVLK